MLLLSLALAGDPGVCSQGLFLAEDGRCAGSRTPFVLPAALGGLIATGNDALIAVEGFDWEADPNAPFRPPQLWWVDTKTGFSRVLPIPYEDGRAGILSLGDGRLLALGPRQVDPETYQILDLPRKVRLFDGQWGEALPAGRRGSSWEVLHGVPWRVGGLTDDGKPSRRVQRYDPAKNVFVDEEPLDVPRAWPAVGVLDGALIACGGYRSEAWERPLSGCSVRREASWEPLWPNYPGGNFELLAYDGGLLAIGGTEGFDSWELRAEEAVVSDLGALDGGTVLSDESLLVRRGTEVAELRGGELGPWLEAPGLMVSEGGELFSIHDDAIVAFEAGIARPERFDPAYSPRGASFEEGIVAWDDGVLAVVDASGVRPLHKVAQQPYAPGLAVWNGSVVLAGGRRDNQASTDVMAWKSGAMVSLPSLPAPLGEAVAEVVGERLVVVGEHSFSLADGGAWEELATLPGSWMGHVRWGERWVHWLAEDGDLQFWALDASMRWEQLPAWPAEVRTDAIAFELVREGHTEPSLVVMGGNPHEVYGGVRTGWVLDAGSERWAPMPPLPYDVHDGTGVLQPDGSVLVFGADRAAVVRVHPDLSSTTSVPASWRDAPMARTVGAGSTLLVGGSRRGARPYELYTVEGEPWTMPSLPSEHRAARSLEAACLAGRITSCEHAARQWDALGEGRRAARARSWAVEEE